MQLNVKDTDRKKLKWNYVIIYCLLKPSILRMRFGDFKNKMDDIILELFTSTASNRVHAP